MRYVIHPGQIISKHDGQEHYITASQLARLYKLKRGEYVVAGPDKSGFQAQDDDVHLSPRYHGDYVLPPQPETGK